MAGARDAGTVAVAAGRRDVAACALAGLTAGLAGECNAAPEGTAADLAADFGTDWVARWGTDAAVDLGADLGATRTADALTGFPAGLAASLAAGFSDVAGADGLADMDLAPALDTAVLADLTVADLRVGVLATLDFLMPTAKPPRWIAHSRIPARKRGTFYFISPGT
ncbi:MAG TPA: hypothetical protein PK359_09075 [Burkholderiaceae bacterium]|nr:hypothetical protein [Burkholderiaceae bacterium]